MDSWGQISRQPPPPNLMHPSCSLAEQPQVKSLFSVQDSPQQRTNNQSSCRRRKNKGKALHESQDTVLQDTLKFCVTIFQLDRLRSGREVTLNHEEARGALGNWTCVQARPRELRQAAQPFWFSSTFWQD